jgi:malate dehydrogenase
MKLSIIGSGNVGSTLALLAAQGEIGDVVMLDVVESMPQGKALDMMQARAVLGFKSTVAGTNDYADIAGSDVVVVTAGLARKPGMSRDDLIQKNAQIITVVCEQIRETCPDCILIMVSNPLDAMSYLALKVTGFPRERVIGMAGVLDAARFRAFVGEELGAHSADVDAMVLGGHGDSMVPLVDGATVNSKPLSGLIPAGKLDSIVERTRKGGAEIVSLLKTGSAYYAPASSAYQMVKAINVDSDETLPASVFLKGEYGIDGVFVGVPVRLDGNGLASIVELDLKEDDLAALRSSAQAVKELCLTHFEK